MNKSIVEVERKKKNKYGYSAVQNTLNEFYKGIGYTKTALYIKKNNYIDQIEFVIDNYDINTILDTDSLKALSIIELMYIQKFMPISKKIYNFLFAYSKESVEQELPQLIKDLSASNFVNCNDIELYITRFSKLKLINISEEDKTFIKLKYNELKDESIRLKLKEQAEKDKNTELITISHQLNIYIPIIQKAYDLYNNGVSYDDLRNLVAADPLTFYKYVINEKDQIDISIREFAVNFATYIYNSYLIKKYGISIFMTEANDAYELCDKIYNFFENNSNMSICKRIDSYITLSPTVTAEEISKLMHIKNIYSKFYESKRTEIEKLRKENYENKKIQRSANLVELFINSENSIDEFCEKNEVNKRTLLNSVSHLKANNHPLYNKYIEYYTQTNSEKEKVAFEVSQIILPLIQTGVKVEDEFRSFDIFDYSSITNLTFNELLELLKNKIPKKDYIIIARFMKNNLSEINWGKEQINSVLNGKHILNAKFDKNNKYIQGSGKEVPLEYKLKAIETLNEINVPLNDVTYHALLNRLMIGQSIDNIKVLGNKETISTEKILTLKK